MSPYLTLNSRIDDVKGDQSWRIFRIISEFTEGFESLSEISEAMAFFGSARLGADHPCYQQTHKVYPIPLVLFGSAFWGGLLDWMRERLVSAGTIVAADLDLITVTDDPQQVLAIMQQHRQWKRLQRQPKA